MTKSSYRDQLLALRGQIDEVDERIVSLLVERFQLTRAVGIVKRDAGLDAVDSVREGELYQRVRQTASARGIDADVVEALYRALMGHVVVEHQAIARGEEGTFGPHS